MLSKIYRGEEKGSTTAAAAATTTSQRRSTSDSSSDGDASRASRRRGWHQARAHIRFSLPHHLFFSFLSASKADEKGKYTDGVGHMHIGTSSAELDNVLDDDHPPTKMANAQSSTQPTTVCSEKL